MDTRGCFHDILKLQTKKVKTTRLKLYRTLVKDLNLKVCQKAEICTESQKYHFLQTYFYCYNVWKVAINWLELYYVSISALICLD